jgi:hypothetical protein
MIPMEPRSRYRAAHTLCAARTQVVSSHELLGVPELSELQSAGASPEANAQGVLGYCTAA